MEVERRKVELPTSALRTCECPDATDDIKGLATTPPPVCTRVCTSEDENVNGSPPQADQGEATDHASLPEPDPLALIAVAIAALSPADRARLAKMLIGQ
jgi:hypothetical protein